MGAYNGQRTVRVTGLLGACAYGREVSSLSPTGLLSRGWRVTGVHRPQTMKLCLGSLSARLGVKACLFSPVAIPSAREDWERIWQSFRGLVKSVWCKRLKEDLKIKAWVLPACWHLMPCPMILCLLLRFVLDFPMSCQAFENERQQRDTVPDLEASAGEPQMQLAVFATSHQMRTTLVSFYMTAS